MRAVERYLSVRQASEALCFSAKWVRARVKEGAFPGAINIRGDIRIPARAIEAFVRRHVVVPDASVAVSARSIGELRRQMAMEVAA